MTRRHALKQTFFFSAALALGARARLAHAAEAAGGDRHFLMIGDWDTTGSSLAKAQVAVATGMKGYVKTRGLILRVFL